MEKLYGILETVLPIVVMLGLGILFKKLRAFTAEGIDNIKKLVLNICLPALLFRTFASVTYTWSVAGVSTTYFLLSCLAIALAFGLKKIFTPKTFLTPFLLTSYESGMIGFALYAENSPKGHVVLSPYMVHFPRHPDRCDGPGEVDRGIAAGRRF